MKTLHDKCMALSARSIAVLSLKDPEGDWHRWLDEAKAVIQTYGQDFVDAFEFAADIPAVAAPGVLDDEPLPLTAPQARQLALRAFIGNSLPSSLEEGTPAWLIGGCAHAGGNIGGAPQALSKLRTRYEVPRKEKDPNQQLISLLAADWPRKLSSEAYQSMVRTKEQQATLCGLSPTGDTDADIRARRQW